MLQFSARRSPIPPPRSGVRLRPACRKPETGSSQVFSPARGGGSTACLCVRLERLTIWCLHQSDCCLIWLQSVSSPLGVTKSFTKISPFYIFICNFSARPLIGWEAGDWVGWDVVGHFNSTSCQGNRWCCWGFPPDNLKSAWMRILNAGDVIAAFENGFSRMINWVGASSAVLFIFQIVRIESATRSC